MQLANGLGFMTREDDQDGQQVFHVVTKQHRYTVYVKNGKPQHRAGWGRLVQDEALRDVVLKAIDADLNEPLVENDPYGDIAIASGRELSVEQNAIRLALYTRIHVVCRDPKTNQDIFMQILKDYYTGAYGNNPSETLSRQLDLIQVTDDFSDLLG